MMAMSLHLLGFALAARGTGSPLMLMRPNFLLLLALATTSVALHVPARHVHRPRAAASRRSAAPILSDSAVIIPNRLPTFGLSEREQVRFRYMLLRAEPLPHEVFGLQILLGAVGTQIAGLVGCLMGTFQIAPCLSWLPGSAGDGLRFVGWKMFALLRSGARSSVMLWHASGLSSAASNTVAAFGRIDQDMRASERATAVSRAVLQFAWKVFVGLASTVATAGGVAARRATAGRASRDGAAAASSAPPRDE